LKDRKPDETFIHVCRRFVKVCGAEVLRQKAAMRPPDIAAFLETNHLSRLPVAPNQ
jgi:hypothetical protein